MLDWQLCQICYPLEIKLLLLLLNYGHADKDSYPHDRLNQYIVKFIIMVIV